MLSSLEGISWDYLRYFAALAEHGSLYAAARALGTSHSTVGRNITLFEQKLSVRLFEKIDNRYFLNADGKRILERVRHVRNQIADIGTVLDLGEPEEREKLPIATTSFVADMLLPNMLGELMHPDISISIDAVIGHDFSPITDDIYPMAISQYRIGRENWTAKVLGQVAVGFYCTDTYIKSSSSPISSRLLRSHRFAVWTDLLRSTGSKSSDVLNNCRNSALVESDSLNLILQATLEGRAIAVLPNCIASRQSGLLSVLEDTHVEGLSIWVHENQKLERSAVAFRLVGALGEALRSLEAPESAAVSCH